MGTLITLTVTVEIEQGKRCPAVSTMERRTRQALNEAWGYAPRSIYARRIRVQESRPRSLAYDTPYQN